MISEAWHAFAEWLFLARVPLSPIQLAGSVVFVVWATRRLSR